MKSLFMSSAAGALLIASAVGTDAANITGGAINEQESESNTKIAQTEKRDTHVPRDDFSVGMYPESDILDEQVDSDDYQMQVVENNSDIRIIILKDEYGQAQFKSVFEKDSKMLKVIDFDQGMIFKGVIDA